MTRVVKPRVMWVSGEPRPYEVVPGEPLAWYDRVVITLLDVPFSVLDLARAFVEGVVLLFVFAAIVWTLVLASLPPSH